MKTMQCKVKCFLGTAPNARLYDPERGGDVKGLDGKVINGLYYLPDDFVSPRLPDERGGGPYFVEVKMSPLFSPVDEEQPQAVVEPASRARPARPRKAKG